MNREGPTEWMDPLHIAVLESDINAVKILLPFIKVYGKYQGKTPFILACEQKEVKIVKAFLEISEEAPPVRSDHNKTVVNCGSYFYLEII